MITFTAIQMRFADVDMLGHVNNVNQQHYFDVGKNAFFSEQLHAGSYWKEQGVITASTTNNYFAQIRYAEPIAVETSVERVGTKSFTLFQRIINIDTKEVKTESRSVMVAFDFVRQVSIPIPEKWRTIFEKAPQ